jgi:putative transposase
MFLPVALHDEIRKRVKHYDVPGHARFLTFSCYRRLPLLSSPVWREWLGAAVRGACDELRVALWAYVFMPEHVHLPIRPLGDDFRVAAFLYRLERPLALRVVGVLRENRSRLLEELTVTERGVRAHRFWQAGGAFDLNVWTMNKAIEKAEYCHRNPVTRRLVRSPEQWRWSSFRWLELGRWEKEPLRVDDRDERLDG